MKRLNVILVDLSIFTCVFTCVTAIVVCATLPRNDALITKENFARLKKGMTHTEVETIIGKRPPSIPCQPTRLAGSERRAVKGWQLEDQVRPLDCEFMRWRSSAGLRPITILPTLQEFITSNHELSQIGA